MTPRRCRGGTSAASRRDSEALAETMLRNGTIVSRSGRLHAAEHSPVPAVYPDRPFPREWSPAE